MRGDVDQLRSLIQVGPREARGLGLVTILLGLDQRPKNGFGYFWPVH